MTGEMTAKRHVYGAMVSGDLSVDSVLFTTDAIFSRAIERLGSATVAASYLGENRHGIDSRSARSICRASAFRSRPSSRCSREATMTRAVPGSSSRRVCCARTARSLTPRGLADISSVQVWRPRMAAVAGLPRLPFRSGRQHTVQPHRPWLCLSLWPAARLSVDVNSGLSSTYAADHREIVTLKVTR